jgi:hypothetical protein
MVHRVQTAAQFVAASPSAKAREEALFDHTLGVVGELAAAGAQIRGDFAIGLTLTRFHHRDQQPAPDARPVGSLMRGSGGKLLRVNSGTDVSHDLFTPVGAQDPWRRFPFLLFLIRKDTRTRGID